MIWIPSRKGHVDWEGVLIAGSPGAAGKVVPCDANGIPIDSGHPLYVTFDQTTPGATNGVQSIGGLAIIPVTPVLDTNIYATGDVLFVPIVVSNAMRVADALGRLHTVTVNDKDDQGFGFDLVVMSANVSLGTINAAVSISDANADSILGIISIAAGDFIDLGGARVATLRNIGLDVKPAAGTRDVYIGGIIRGAGTYTASGIVLQLGFDQR